MQIEIDGYPISVQCEEHECSMIREGLKKYLEKIKVPISEVQAITLKIRKQVYSETTFYENEKIEFSRLKTKTGQIFEKAYTHSVEYPIPRPNHLEEEATL